jgi:hypothetical protein
MALCLLLVPLFQRLEAWLALQAVRIASNLHLQQPLLASPQQQEGPLDLTKPLFESPSDLDVRGAGHRAARSYVLIVVPTCFDIVSTLLKKVGLLFLLASVYQSACTNRRARRPAAAAPSAACPLAAPAGWAGALLRALEVPRSGSSQPVLLSQHWMSPPSSAVMRSTEIIFAACLSVPLLRRPLDRSQLGGISLCLAGVALVGWASVLDSHPKAHGVTPTQTLVGIALVVVRASPAAPQRQRVQPAAWHGQACAQQGACLGRPAALRVRAQAGEAIQAVQNVAEDAFMTNMRLAPIRLVGCARRPRHWLASAAGAVRVSFVFAQRGALVERALNP